MTTEEIKEQCENIRSVIDEAIQSSFLDALASDEEKKFAEDLIKSLEELNKTFKIEIDDLSKNAEWEKFCIAFLGETNAGKSTLIESMRILYNEESRLEQFLKNRNMALQNLKINNEVYSKLIADLKDISAIITKNRNFYGKSKFIWTSIISFIIGGLFMIFISLIF